MKIIFQGNDIKMSQNWHKTDTKVEENANNPPELEWIQMNENFLSTWIEMNWEMESTGMGVVKYVNYVKYVKTRN